MTDLDVRGKRILEYLVSKLEDVIPGEPKTYANYKLIHDKLNLKMQGSTYGDSLKKQGLLSLTTWIVENHKPGITGIIIDLNTGMPAEKYFRMFGKKSLEDIQWWHMQVQFVSFPVK